MQFRLQYVSYNCVPRDFFYFLYLRAVLCQISLLSIAFKHWTRWVIDVYNSEKIKGGVNCTIRMIEESGEALYIIV